MSQERWDVVLRFTDGPLSYQGDFVARGPVVRMGRNPGPGGLSLEGYRGLDDRQAVVTAYDGATVSIAPVGANQVRVAPHEHVDWNELQPIRGPTYLSPGAAFHLGTPARGVTAVFLECRRLGVWEQGRILSDAAQTENIRLAQASNVKELSTRRGMPLWFIPAMLGVGFITAVAVTIPLIGLYARDIEQLGPVAEGEEFYEFVDASKVEVDPELKEGLDQAFFDFVMKPNADRAQFEELKESENWDSNFYDYVNRSVRVHAKAWAFWQRLDTVVEDYRLVVEELDGRGMPSVFAAIPYQESRYKADVQSVACAKGYWQMLPEVANRAGLKVANCRLRGSDRLFTPTAIVPVRGVMKNAPYIDPERKTCRITSCEVDERTELAVSTRGAMELLGEAWNDEVMMSSGAAVQLTILSHNAGLDNAAIEGGSYNIINVKPAYLKYLKATNQTEAPDFYGANITCTDPSMRGVDNFNKVCGGYVANHSQHYAYNIVAQHILAVCYYATNYGSQAPFNRWRDYIRGDGYCTRLKVPSQEQVAARKGR